MLKGPADVGFNWLTIEQAARALTEREYTNVIGHKDLNNLVYKELNIPYREGNRIGIKLNFTDSIIVAQLSGGRLPEGTTELPDGVAIQYWDVVINGYVTIGR
jgi:hypothetical protein